jgi:hypothetical protein
MAFEIACQFREMGTSGRALIDMRVTVVSAGGRVEHPKYGVVVSDQFNEADPATSGGWRASRFPSVKLRIKKPATLAVTPDIEMPCIDASAILLPT